MQVIVLRIDVAFAWLFMKPSLPTRATVLFDAPKSPGRKTGILFHKDRARRSFAIHPQNPPRYVPWNKIAAQNTRRCFLPIWLFAILRTHTLSLSLFLYLAQYHFSHRGNIFILIRIFFIVSGDGERGGLVLVNKSRHFRCNSGDLLLVRASRAKLMNKPAPYSSVMLNAYTRVLSAARHAMQQRQGRSDARSVTEGKRPSWRDYTGCNRNRSDHHHHHHHHFHHQRRHYSLDERSASADRFPGGARVSAGFNSGFEKRRRTIIRDDHGTGRSAGITRPKVFPSVERREGLRRLHNANRRRVNRLRQTRSGRGVLFNLAQVPSPSPERARAPAVLAAR